jgi:hypothetical protein
MEETSDNWRIIIGFLVSSICINLETNHGNLQDLQIIIWNIKMDKIEKKHGNWHIIIWNKLFWDSCPLASFNQP